MRTNIIVIDDFYSNPYEVRNFALEQEFNVAGNYPGLRTQPLINDSTKHGLRDILFQSSGEVIDWQDNQYTGCFQLCYDNDKTWVHTDAFNTWSGVVYLTPDAPLEAGTALYRHKRTGHRTDLGEVYEPQDYSKWEVTDMVGNVFNRLILFRGNLWHAANGYFGNTRASGRLIQTFFICTER
jgi:Family of unknown function (DUF6445)